MNKTKIEYLGYSWNPIAMRCTPVSEGCANCWHLDTNRRFKLHSGPPRLREKELESPFRLKKPAVIGVQFMGDLFHKDIKVSQLNPIFNVIKRSWELDLGHQFIVLTKRPKPMKRYIEEHINYETAICSYDDPNIWLGVTVELPEHLHRINDLLKIPGKRFVSIEPMLGPINLTVPILPPILSSGCTKSIISQLDGVILGGESGPGARPTHPNWVRSVRDQCVEAGVPFFFKQWGEWCPDDYSTVLSSGKKPPYCSVHSEDGETFDWCYPYNSAEMMKVGKKKAGRLLDGRTWDDLPWRAK